MRKRITFLLLGVCLLNLQGCISFGDNEGNNTTQIERITEGDPDFNEEDHIKAYYPTIAEAIKNNTFSEGKPADFTWVKTLKLMEDNDSCVFYGIILQPGGEEIFAQIRFRIQNKDGRKEYSNLLSYGPIPGEFINNRLHKNDSVIKEQDMSLNLYSNTYATKTLKNYPNFAWSLSAKKEVKKIKVNSQKPTEIIPFKLGKEKFYFYYFDNLENNDENEDLVITTQ